jgi:hypothetical protein
MMAVLSLQSSSFTRVHIIVGVARLGKRCRMVETAFLDTSLLAAVTLGCSMVTPRLVDATWLTRGWLSVASTGIPVIR